MYAVAIIKTAEGLICSGFLTEDNYERQKNFVRMSNYKPTEVPIMDDEGNVLSDLDGNIRYVESFRPPTEDELAEFWRDLTEEEILSTFNSLDNVRYAAEAVITGNNIHTATLSWEPIMNSYDNLVARAKDERTTLLSKCDWTQLPDSPLDGGTKNLWAIYRQGLRDITEQDNFPYTITWPVPPNI